MYGVDNNGYVIGLQYRLQFVGYLHGKTFLYLRAAGKVFYDAVKLRQSYDLTRRDVTNVCLPDDGYEVVLAIGIECDIALYQHLVVVVFILEKLDLGFILRIEAAEYLFYVHFGYPGGRTRKTIVCEVEPQGVHDLVEMTGYDAHLLGVTEIER